MNDDGNKNHVDDWTRKYEDVDNRIIELIGTGLSLKQAATQVLESKPGWYVQTPEGEHLLAIIARSLD